VFLKKRIKSFYENFISLKGDPKNIAMGMAIGVFVGVTPTIPFHTALLILATILCRQNMTAAYLGSWIISNPLTIPFFYFTQYELGRYLMGIEAYNLDKTCFSLQHVVGMGWYIAIPLLLGGIIMAPFFAIAAYFITHHAIIIARKKYKS